MKTLIAALLFAAATSLTVAHAGEETRTNIGPMGQELDTTYLFETIDCDGRVIGWMVVTPSNAWIFRPPALKDPDAVEILSQAVVTAAQGDTFFQHTICSDRKEL